MAPISPTYCKHRHKLFVQSGRAAPPPPSHHVSLCPDCGEFCVFTKKEGVYSEIRFVLVTEELVEAAGQYLKNLRDRKKMWRELVWAAIFFYFTGYIAMLAYFAYCQDTPPDPMILAIPYLPLLIAGILTVIETILRGFHMILMLCGIPITWMITLCKKLIGRHKHEEGTDN